MKDIYIFINLIFLSVFSGVEEVWSLVLQRFSEAFPAITHATI